MALTTSNVFVGVIQAQKKWHDRSANLAPPAIYNSRPKPSPSP